MAARGILVTGTDTGVGKTLVAVALLRALGQQGLRAVGMKPVAAGIEPGADENEDVTALRRAGNVTAARDLVNPYAFVPAIAPHVAAASAGIPIVLERIVGAYARLAALADVVVVEGAGGALVPLGARADMLDIAHACALPVLLVVGLRLGCINHALLTALAIRRRGLVLRGWVVARIDPAMAEPQASVDALVQRLDAPLLGDFPAPERVAFGVDTLCALWPGERPQP